MEKNKPKDLKIRPEFLSKNHRDVKKKILSKTPIGKNVPIGTFSISFEYNFLKEIIGLDNVLEHFISHWHKETTKLLASCGNVPRFLVLYTKPMNSEKISFISKKILSILSIYYKFNSDCSFSE